MVISSVKQVIMLHIIIVVIIIKAQYQLMVIKHKTHVIVIGFIINLVLFTIAEQYQFTAKQVTKLQFTIIFFY